MFSRRKKEVHKQQQHQHQVQTKKGRSSKQRSSVGSSAGGGSERQQQSTSSGTSADIVLINSLFSAASRYQQRQEYSHALARYQELKEIFSQLPRTEYELVMRREAHVSFLIGMIHEAQTDFVKAMDNYSDAVKIYRENRILIAEYGAKHPKENIQPTLLKVNYKLVQVMACMGALQPKLNLTKWDFALNINQTALKLLEAVAHQCPALYDTKESKAIKTSLEKNIADIHARKNDEILSTNRAGGPNTSTSSQHQPPTQTFVLNPFQMDRDDDYTLDTNVPFRDLIVNGDDAVSINSSVSGLTKLIRDDAYEFRNKSNGKGVAEALVSPFLLAGEKAFDALDGALAALDGKEPRRS